MAPVFPSFNFDIVTMSYLLPLALTLNAIDVILVVNNDDELCIVNTPLDIVNPLLPEVTLAQTLPPSTLYCQLEYEQFTNDGVIVIDVGE